MTEDRLRRQLHRLEVPEASESARGRARHRALIAFRQAGPNQTGHQRHPSLGWSWRYTLVLAVVLSVAPFFFIHHSRHTENLADDRRILEQMEKLFPQQLNAVVVENGKVNLSIAESPLIGSSQPVVLVFQRSRQTIRVLSFSGHQVCLDLGQGHKCLEILENPSGGFILEDGSHVWKTSDHPVVGGFSVQAQTLEASL